METRIQTNFNRLPLLNLSPIECKEDIDERFEKCYIILQDLIKGSSESEAHDTLMAMVSKSTQDHDNVCLGLLTSILVDPSNASRYYRDLTYVSRDGMNFVITWLNHIIIERYPKLHDGCRGQLIWVLRELIKNSITACETIAIALLRQIAGGDISIKNLWLTEKMLDLLIDNRSWLDKNNLLIAISVYTYLRLIVDHGSPNLTLLRQKEIDFCSSLLKEKFTDCLVIGRDLVRLLQNVARIPEFEKIWKDIFNNPTSLSPNFQGVLQLMQARTSRRFLQSRLTPDMEKKIVYLTSFVKFGQQRRYQEWFQRQYLSTPESQSLRCDLIRYICGVIHPSNEVLCSEIIPRWAIIGWILSSCTSNVAAANAKLSLFYDWLFYDKEKDNIMNIEPAILVMFHSMRNHSVITVGLLDFLCRIVTQFCPSLATQVKQGVSTSLSQILEKRVLPSLSSLFESPKLDPELRSLIRETFPEFCSSANDISVFHNSIPGTVEPIPIRDNVEIILDSPKVNHHNIDSDISDNRFSDDESETSSSSNGGSAPHQEGVDKKSNPNNSMNDDNLNCTDKKTLNGPVAFSRATFDSNLSRLNGELRSTVLALEESKDNETRCELMEKILQLILQDDEFGDEFAALPECILYALREEITKSIFPECPDEEALEESIGSPLFVIFRNLCQTPEENPNRVPILSLLNEMSSSQPSIGYLLLYYMKVSKSYDVKVSPYRDFAKSLGKDLKNCLLTDLKACADYDDINLFCYLIPDIFNHFPMIANNPDLLHLIVSCIDSSQLQELVCLILQGNLIMFRKDGLLSLLNASLEWETFEQFCLWQLFVAHSMPVEYILPILPKLEFQKHSEALTNILLLIKREEPSQELLKHIISRDAREKDHFVVSLLKYWTSNTNNMEELAKLLGAQLTKQNATKRKRPANNKLSLLSSTEQILIYLDQLRQTNMNSKFFTHESIQKALISTQELCSDTQKSRFSDLFALIDDHDSKPKRGKTSNKKVKAKPVEESNSDTEASEEETTPVKKENKSSTPRKKRKTIVASDSD